MSKLFLFILVMICFSISSFSQEITMFPGFFGMSYYQNSKPISSRQVAELMKKVPEAEREWKKSSEYNIGAGVAFAGQLGFLVWQINKLKNYESGKTQLIGNLACGTIAIAMSISAQNAKKRAILTYNYLIKKNQKTGYFFTPSSEGIGVALHF